MTSIIVCKFSMSIVLLLLLALLVNSHDLQNVVCKWNISSQTCQKNPSEMINLLEMTEDDFAYMMRCDYAKTKNVCNNLSHNACVWDQKKCRVSLKFLTNTISKCTNDQNCIQEFKNLQESENLWVDQKNVFPTKSCQYQIDYFNTQLSTCSIIQRMIECQKYGPNKWFRTCGMQQENNKNNYNENNNNKSNNINNDQFPKMFSINLDNNNNIQIQKQCKQIEQITKDITYIMGIQYTQYSSRMIGFDFLEQSLEIRKGNLQMYGKCNKLGQSNCENFQSLPPGKNSHDHHEDIKLTTIYIIAIVILIVFIIIMCACFYFCGIMLSCCKKDVNISDISNRAGPLSRIVINNNRNNQEGQNNSRQTMELTNQQVLRNIDIEYRRRTRRQEQQSRHLQLEEMLNRLANMSYKESEECSQTTCTICFEDFELGEKINVLPCNHKFHSYCFKQWSQQKGVNVACPLCNLKVHQHDNYKSNDSDEESV